jgi:carbamoyl-phosphate synthase large subunit
MSSAAAAADKRPGPADPGRRGEVACLGEDVHEAYLKAILSTGFTLPKKNILLTIGGEESKHRFLGAAQILAGLGFRIFATDRTSAYLKENGVPATRLFKVHERRGPNIREYLADRKIKHWAKYE